MTRYTSMDTLRASISPDVVVVEDAPYPTRIIDYGEQARQTGALGGAMPELAAQSIVLALPPSANVYWRHGVNGVYVSQEAQNYKAGVKYKALHQHMQPMSGEIAMYINVYRARKSGDLDNFAKVLSDSLNGIAYHDDSQVVELHMWRHDDKANPRVEVELRKVTA